MQRRSPSKWNQILNTSKIYSKNGQLISFSLWMNVEKNWERFFAFVFFCQPKFFLQLIYFLNFHAFWPFSFSFILRKLTNIISLSILNLIYYHILLFCYLLCRHNFERWMWEILRSWFCCQPKVFSSTYLVSNFSRILTI